MYMAWHNAPTVYFHSFIFPAIIQTFNYFLKIQLSYKNINPIDGSKTYEVQTLLIVKFVFSTHKANVKLIFVTGYELKTRTS